MELNLVELPALRKKENNENKGATEYKKGTKIHVEQSILGTELPLRRGIMYEYF
jgi:hypothetical protein